MVSLGSTIYMFGGMINEDRYSDLYSFNTETSHWTRLQDGPMVGRGGAGLVVVGGDAAEFARLLVIAGHVGHGVSDVWEYAIAAKSWQAREELSLPVPCSIFACGVIAENPEVSTICLFGGELNHTTTDTVAGQYSQDTLLLRSSVGRDQCSVRVLPSSGAGCVPSARGWTSGCVLKPEAAGNCVFAVFGGVREGTGEGEASGVRLGDLAIFEC